MSRIARQVDNNSYHHVFTRGNNRKRLFRNDQDFRIFLSLIEEALQKYGIEIYNYCLMPNHIHFLLKVITSQDLREFMKNILQRYAYYFRKRYNHVGFLYQNRYKNIPIEKESYLLECARYIERNPVRANIVRSADEYKWSSYPFYACGKDDRIIKNANPVHIQLSNDTMERRIKYREYVATERPYEQVINKGLGMD